MTKRQEIEESISTIHTWTSSANHECFNKVVAHLREYQQLLPPDREPWEVAYRERYELREEDDVVNGPLSARAQYFYDGYLARDAEKQERSK